MKRDRRRWLFASGHLEREDLQAVSKPFAELAEGFVDVTLAEQVEIARRWLHGEPMRAVAKSLD